MSPSTWVKSLRETPIARTMQLLHTVRYLRAEQVVARVRKRLSHPRPDFAPAPERRSPIGPWVVPIPRPQSLFGDGSALFLNRREQIDGTAAWNDSNSTKLWLYNLHYFDDLTRRGNGRFQAKMIERWIAENPAPFGNGWEPYTVSLRIVNWIKWSLNGNTLTTEMHNSLATQVRWLSRNLEYHLLGNHLFANAKALTIAGLFFNGQEAEEWLDTGCSLLAREISEQILPDGGHFELSPMYHAIILEDMLDLWNVAQAFGWSDRSVFVTLHSITTKMRKWLHTMCHPDGRIAFFNDAAFGIAPELPEIERYSAALDLPIVVPPKGPLIQLSHSGYIRLEANGLTAFLDVAEVGPDYIPGHAHADTLSFELSLGGARMFVNGGTSTYEPSQKRLAERETRAHNTVEVAGVSSSEVWSAFRVARRARVCDLTITPLADGYVISASHNGYHRLAGRPTHRRTWNFTSEELRIEDSIRPVTDAIARYRLAPGVRAELAPGATSAQLYVQDRIVSITFSAPARLVPSLWHPEFGRSVATQTFELPLPHGKSLLIIRPE